MSRHRLRSRRPRPLPQRRQPIAGSLHARSASALDWERFAADLSQLETAVHGLRQRFDQAQQLQQQRQGVQDQLAQPDLSASETEELQRQLDELEATLESAVISWRSLSEPFWQAVRFGGLGIVIGWVLRAIATGR